MSDKNAPAFTHLFTTAYVQCFGHALQTPLSETESKQFSNAIFEQTGLVVGWKSLKNYSFYILGDAAGKPENPSVATLDTLARYVLQAPYTDEVQRKNKESHYPYWFRYKEQFYQRVPQPRHSKRRPMLLIGLLMVVAVAIILLLVHTMGLVKAHRFTEDFHTIHEDSLQQHGWMVQLKDTASWSRRGELPGHLTLFTLPGDNWPQPGKTTGIKNLVLHRITSDCFTAEVHLTNFVPQQNWQQAGLALLEDTSFTGKSLRISFAYNDFTGGAPAAREILIQAITVLGTGFNKPEEIAHKHLFSFAQDADSFIINNMAHTALRIEKQGNRLRLLYANGGFENTAFKEVVSQEFDIKPAYIGLFALRGFAENSQNKPAYFKLFTLAEHTCSK